jgi:nitrate/TMAO reductase-like tetraheme cytochrome c subunit
MATSLKEAVRDWIRPAVFLGHNGITEAGAILTTSSALTLLMFWVYESSNATRHVHPYAGILLFLILPSIFVVGLVLMPMGVILTRRRLRASGELPVEYPVVRLSDPLLQRAAILVAGLTIVNVVIMGIASYKGLEYMDSQQFCGQTCHTVMAPEYSAYQNSPHSRVSCTECHIGPGASWFVKAKISGLRQVWAVTFKTYSRPIPSPVEHLRPARETCEQCHWPQRFSGDKFIVRTAYASDEKNTAQTTVLVLKIGGRNGTSNLGIHGRHIDASERIEYVSTDRERQVIPHVSYRDDSGKIVEYDSKDVKVTAADLAKGERRKMDCVDCHNRPTHAFELPDRAVDRRIEAGLISQSLPFVKKKAVELLKIDYPSRSEAARAIRGGLVDFYKETYPDVYRERRAAVEAAAEAVQSIYLRNVFPNMKVTWGVHPNNIGHEDSPGCFRCHDGEHVSADGKVIASDCDTCHNILAQDETNPKILADLGVR